jgi:hypothetical protein
MTARTDVLLWAQRVMRKKDAQPCTLLEIAADASYAQVQEAFHKIARTAHPDLHRTTLNAEELELVTSAYARVAGAYQAMRTQAPAPTQRIAPIAAEPPRTQPLPKAQTQPVPKIQPISAEPSSLVPATPSGPAPAPAATQQMSSKALVYYRKAELCLKRGDLKGSVLQLKLACAADPTSVFLRTALAEVQAEIGKT